MRAGEKMRALRGKRSQKEVSEAIGVSYSAYVKFERGERNPRDPVKIRIAEYFGVTVGYIFFE